MSKELNEYYYGVKLFEWCSKQIRNLSTEDLIVYVFDATPPETIQEKRAFNRMRNKFLKMFDDMINEMKSFSN